jgi:hypothetical protein
MSLFVNLLERNIAAEFFNNFLSVEDLSILQCSCKSVQKTILEWKENFECLEELKMCKYVKEFERKKYLQNQEFDVKKDKKLLSFVKNVHKNVKRISITNTMSDLAYYYVTLVKNVEELKVNNICQNGLRFITSSMSSLTKLTLSRYSKFAPSLCREEFDSITHLSNLNSLTMSQMHYFDDNAGVNFHKLKLLRSFKILFVHDQFKTGHNFISTLTSLTNLWIIDCCLNDEELKKICLCCQSLVDLDVRNNSLLTSAGLNNITRLKNINSFGFTMAERLGQEKFICGPLLFWEKFKKISTLTCLDLSGSNIDEEDLAQIEHLTLINFKINLRYVAEKVAEKRRED